MQKFIKNEPIFNGVYFRDNLPKIKEWAYIINLDEQSDIETHWVALYVQNNNNNIIYFNSFSVEHILKEIKAFINRPSSSALPNKNITTNIFIIQAYNSIMCGYFCIGFIDFMLAGKTLTEYANLFPPNNSQKTDNIILNYFYGQYIK